MGVGVNQLWVQMAAPFFLLVVLTVFGIPATMAVRRWMKEGPLKTALLDRNLTKRKPWIRWLAVFLALAAIPLFGALGMWLSSLK